MTREERKEQLMWQRGFGAELPSNTKARIEHVKLLQELKRGDETPGQTTLRVFRAMLAISDKERLANSLTCQLAIHFRAEVCFANANVATRVANCIAETIKEAIEHPNTAV